MVCVGSISSAVNFFLCEQGSKGLDLSTVRGEGRAPEITVTKAARFDELDNISFVGYKVLPPGYTVTGLPYVGQCYITFSPTMQVSEIALHNQQVSSRGIGKRVGESDGGGTDGTEKSTRFTYLGLKHVFVLVPYIIRCQSLC